MYALRLPLPPQRLAHVASRAQLIPLHEGLIRRDQLAFELGHALAASESAPESPLRRSAAAITLFKSCGHALQDLAAAQSIVESARRLKLGHYVDLL